MQCSSWKAGDFRQWRRHLVLRSLFDEAPIVDDRKSNHRTAPSVKHCNGGFLLQDCHKAVNVKWFSAAQGALNVQLKLLAHLYAAAAPGRCVNTWPNRTGGSLNELIPVLYREAPMKAPFFLLLAIYWLRGYYRRDGCFTLWTCLLTLLYKALAKFGIMRSFHNWRSGTYVTIIVLECKSTHRTQRKLFIIIFLVEDARLNSQD